MSWSFDSTPHLYRIHGRIVPSVTEICDDEPIPYGPDGDKEGKAIHHATLAFDLGAYHHDDYPPFVDPHIVVYQTFLKVYRPRWTRLEQAKVHEAGFGGTADRLGILRVTGLDSIVDIKSGAPCEWHPWQTAGYDLLHDDLPPRVRVRFGLYLTPTHFRFLQHRFRSDYAAFVHRAREMGVKL